MLFLVTFFLIFGWKITPFIDISAISACILSIQHFYLHKKWQKTIKNPATIALIALTLYSTILALSTGVTDLLPIFRSLRALITLIAGFSLYNIYKKHYINPIYKMSYDVYVSLLVHSIIMILMYSFSPLRIFVYTITNASDYVNLNTPFLDGIRICGLTYGLSQTSVLHLFGFFLIPILFNKSNKYCSRTFILLSFPIILISSLLGGRSGLFLGIVLIPIYIILIILLSKFSINRFVHSLKLIALGIISLGLLSSLIYFLLPDKSKAITINNSLQTFEAFKLKGTTIDELKSMYILPKEFSKTIFGIGNYGRTDTFYLESDVGWARSIFALGLIGTFLMMYPYIWGIYTSFNLEYKYRKIAIAAILIFLATLLLNFKELSILTRNQWTIQAIMLVILAKCEKKEIEEQ